MVKYGLGEVTCLTCQSCIIVKTQVLRDKKWEMSLLKKNCDHFTLSIDLYTKDTYLPVIKRDEIRFQLNAVCNICDKKDQCASACSQLNAVKSGNRQFTCHANTASFRWGFWPNFWADVYDVDKYDTKFTLVKDNDYLKKITFEESSEYIKERKQVKDHLKEGVYQPASNRWGELIRPDGTFNYPNEIEYKNDRHGGGGSSNKKRTGSIICHSSNNSNVYIDFNIEEMNKMLRYSYGNTKKLLHSLVALVDIDIISSSERVRTMYGWDLLPPPAATNATANGASTTTLPSSGWVFRGDKIYFDNMALNRKFTSERAYTDRLAKIDLVGFVPAHKVNGIEVKYVNIHVKIDAESFGSVLVPCELNLGQHNIRHMLIESINNTSVIMVEPYSHRNGVVSHWVAAVLVKKLKKILWYFKINEIHA